MTDRPRTNKPANTLSNTRPNTRPNSRTGTSDLRGAARLAADATAGLTGLVEAVHARIGSLPGGTPRDERTRGITGLVYKTIRGVTRLAGGGVDALFGALPLGADAGLPSPEREAVVAALNGVLGDHLEARANPLATPMALRSEGRALPLDDKAALAARLPDAGAKLLVLLHGLCMNDLQWQRDGHDHGALLARELGYTPIYLHYNSGRPISANGRDFGALMGQLVAAWPRPLERLVMLGHSMGGLVARSALHQAPQAGQAWAERVDDLVCLGTPHHGAPLERAGHGIDILLGAAPYAAPFARLSRLRSAGITDLRHGRLLHPDPAFVALPRGVRCFAMASTLGERPGDLKDSLLGDGLVPLDSALGRHADPARTLAFEAERQWVGHGIGHLQLLSDAGGAAQLRRWLE